MKVLMITGDKNFKPGHERYELQRGVVDELAVVYWGRGSLWPSVPAGQFDVVTAQDPFWRGLFGWWVAKRKGAKLDVQIHTDLSVYGGVRHVLMQITLRHADSIRVVSEKIKQQVERVGIKAKVTVLPVYVDIQKFRTVTPAPHDGKIILWIGRFEDEKDPLLAIEIFKKVRKSAEAKLIFLGKGSLESSLRAAARDLPVEFAGWQDPMQFLPTADVVLSTSKHESFGASILESLAAGVPVVAPDVGWAKDAGAIVVAEKDKLADAVVEILKTPRNITLNPVYKYDKKGWAAAWLKTLQ